MKLFVKIMYQFENMLALMLQLDRINRNIMFAFILILSGWFSVAQSAEILTEKPVNLGEKLEFK